ncbi:MAG: hypothetical protein Q4A71_00555 [Actinomycetaceae bacterium]|nr:hypothetical protein [Actinomycetaceae bacterium]
MKTTFERLYGPAGWTNGQVRNILQGNTFFSGRFASSDYDPFCDLQADAAAALLKLVPEPQLQDRQNFAPTFKQLLQATCANPEQMALDGYLIGPGRFDERVTIEAFTWKLGEDDPHSTVAPWQWLKERVFGDAEIAPPDEISPVYVDQKLHGWWVWWD